MTETGAVAEAFRAQYFLHGFLREYRLHSQNPDLGKRLKKKLRKFDSRLHQPGVMPSPIPDVGAVPALIPDTIPIPDATPGHVLDIPEVTAVTSSPDVPHPTVISAVPDVTHIPDVMQLPDVTRVAVVMPVPEAGFVPGRVVAEPRRVSGVMISENLQRAIAERGPAPVEIITISPPPSPPLAGPGPTTTLNRNKRNIPIFPLVPLRRPRIDDDEDELDDDEYDEEMLKGKVRERLGFGDLEADGEDDPDAMVGIEESIESFMRNAAVGGMKGEGKGKGHGKGKGKARELDTLSESSDESRLSVKAIVSRPRPQTTKLVGHAPRIHPSGTFLDPPCAKCAAAKVKCERDVGGGSCVRCKRRKKGCVYGARVNRKVKSKAVVESEDEDEDDAARLPRPVPPTAQPTREPPFRRARHRAQDAIRAVQTGATPLTREFVGKMPRRRVRSMSRESHGSRERRELRPIRPIREFVGKMPHRVRDGSRESHRTREPRPPRDSELFPNSC